MATKKTTKKAATAKSSPKKTTAAAATSKTTVTRVTSKAETKKPEVKSTAVKPVKTSSPRKKIEAKLPRNLVNIVLAEVAGTFILTLVALFSAYFLFIIPSSNNATIRIFTGIKPIYFHKYATTSSGSPRTIILDTKKIEAIISITIANLNFQLLPLFRLI